VCVGICTSLIDFRYVIVDVGDWRMQRSEGKGDALCSGGGCTGERAASNYCKPEQQTDVIEDWFKEVEGENCGNGW